MAATSLGPLCRRLVSGLQGAADNDGDGRVTLSEAYAFAYEGTLRASGRSLAGTQHPTFSYDLGGREDIVFTTLAAQAGRPFGTLTAVAGTELPLSGRLVLTTAVAANVHAFKQRDNASSSTWAAPVTFMARIGLGLRW